MSSTQSRRATEEEAMWRQSNLQPLSKPEQTVVPRPRRSRVLLAEDDAFMRSLLTRALKSAGYDVVPCDDGWALLSHLGSFLLAREDHEDIDVVVSDIRMPGVDGMEVLRGAEDCESFPPMILITAFGDARTHAEAERFGAVAIFDKPFDIDELIERVRSVVPPEIIARDGSAADGTPPQRDDDAGPRPEQGGGDHA
jgi:DNA-binding NtrC family response regulator